MISEKKRKKMAEIFILFVIGGLLYALVEVLARGHSYPAMIIIGGLCFVLIGGINERFGNEMAVISQMFFSALIITAVEFLSGLFFNVLLNMNLWDYTNDPYNLLGQISLKTSVFWFFLSLIGIVLDDFLRNLLFKFEKKYYKIF